MPNPPLDLLCIEPRFPGRLGAVADWLVRRRGYRARFYCQNAGPRETWPESTGKGIEVVAYNVGGVARDAKVDWPRVLERSLCHSFGCWEVLESRRPRPIDVVLGRSDGLGSSLFATVTYPRVPVVQMFDSYFDPKRREFGDDEPRPEAYAYWRRAANAIDLVELENGVRPWTPTAYQRSLFPAEYRDDFLVLHDGVETRHLPPRNRGRLAIAGRTIPEGARVVTFAARSLDRLRGFDRFVVIVRALQVEFPDLIAVAVGAPVGDHPFDYAHFGREYGTSILNATPLIDPSRLWTPGLIPIPELRKLFARTDLHLYPSRPHPASRSLVEAMAGGAVVLAFPTEAALEFVVDGVTGRVTTEDGIMESLAILRGLDAHRPLGDAAAERIGGSYARDVTLPSLADHFDRLIAGSG